MKKSYAKSFVRLFFGLLISGALASGAGCSATGSNTREDAVEPVPIPPEEQEDADCAEQIESVRVKFCVDTPPTLPFDHLDRALDYFHKFRNMCPEQMRSTYGLRRLEDCIYQIEKNPAMQNDDRDARRHAGKKKAEEIKQTDEFVTESKRIARSLRSSSDAAIAYNEAVEDGDENEAKFQGAAWDEAEYQYRKARKRIEAMMEHVGLNLDDGRFYGLW